MIVDRLAWAAGLFEGEGSIQTRGVRPGKTGKACHTSLHLTTTDEDVAQMFAAAVGCGKVYGPYRQSGNRKPHWRWTLHDLAAIRRVLEQFANYLGVRRSVVAVNALASDTRTEALGGT